MNLEKPAQCISVYKNAINPVNFITALEQESKNDWGLVSWNNSSVGGNGQVVSGRTSTECDVTHLLSEHMGNMLVNTFVDHIIKPVLQLVDDYKVEYLVHTNRPEGWRILKYSEGSDFKAHSDHHPNNARVISLVAFLNDVEDGGNLEFPHFDVSIPAEKGSVVIFPSNFPYLHIAHPVESGVKYSLVTWFQ